MHSHITNVLEIIDKLSAIGETIDDSHIAAILLCSLPSSYDTLITALEARPDTDLTSNFIKTKLIDEYTRRTESSLQKDCPNRAYQLNAVDRAHSSSYTPNNSIRQHNNFKNNFKKDNKFCVYCKKSSHVKADCWHLKNKNKTNRGYSKTENKSALCYLESTNGGINNHSQSNLPSETPNTKNEKEEFAFITNQPNKNVWIFDSGSSSHITNNKNLFKKLYDINKSRVIVANGHVLTSYGSGDIEFSTNDSNCETRNIKLKNVLYVPEIKANLLSVKRATESGSTVVFDKNVCKLIHDGKVYLTGNLNNNLYQVDFENKQYNTYANVVSECKNENCVETWHKRLGHRNYDSINQLVTNDLAIGFKINKCTHRVDCETCTQSKLTNKPYPKKSERKTTKILDLVHSDLCGPIKTPTIGGKTYLLTFIDDFSRYTTIYLISHKNEVLAKLREYIALVKNKFGRIPKALRSDNGREYVNRDMTEYLSSLGIKHQRSVPHSPQQNSVAERKNRSLMEMTRCLLNQANVPRSLWGEAVNTAVYLQNRLPTKINEKTPFEYWEKYRPNLSNLKIFGCKAYSYIDKSSRTKLDDRSRPGIFTGYDSNSKGYRIYTGGKSIIISRTVKFLEHIFPHSESQSSVELPHAERLLTQEYSRDVDLDFESEPETEKTEIPKLNTDEPRRSERTNKGVPPDRLIYLTQPDPIYEPNDWSDVQNINNPIEKANWLKATQEEYNSLIENKTWTLVDPPQGKNIIGCRWTFKAKYNSNGEIEKYKARLVAKGFSQKFGIDYDETYASVVSHTTLRAILAAASYKKLNVRHLDVKTAFLHGQLSEDIYMAQPVGYIKPGNEGKVCKLSKAIYGLKQAARAWQLKIERTLKDLNFVQSVADPCLYVKGKGENITYVVVYVDDILVVGNEDNVRETTDSLGKQFEIKDLGPIRFYLGINVRKTEAGHYALSQKLKIKEVINKFNLNDCKPCNTPMEPGYPNNVDDQNLLPNNKKFRSAIGALLYIATITRPDILAAVNILSRRNEKPRAVDWEQCKRVIRYLKTTDNFELLIDPMPNAKLICYSDADWAGDKLDRKSTSGNLFMLGNAPLNWISKKQNCVSLSSAEAEYVAAANASQEILWLDKLLKDIDLTQELPIKMFMDNQPAIKMIESPKYMSKTKHVDIKFHCVRNLKNSDIIDIHYCPSSEMIADIFTKPVPKGTLVKHRSHLQLSASNDVQ